MPLILDGTNGEVFPSWTTATRPASPTAGQTGYNTTTKQMETYNGTAWGICPSATTQGTSGQYLQSAGAGAAPTWATLSSTGALIRAPQILTSGTSYTTPSNCTSIYVEAVGGGGGGGGGNGIGSGGGAGAYCAKYFTVTGSTAYTYAIGSAGTGGTSGPGGNGGNTTFTVGATTITAGFGSNGLGGASGTQLGGAGGTATNGDFNSSGTGGACGSTAGVFGGNGGASVFGGGGRGNTANPGGAAGGYGSGGGGGQGSGQNGGAGSTGVIRIWEFT